MADTTANNLKDLNGNFKEIYGSQLENLLPDEVSLQRDVAFQSDGRPGHSYNQGVITRREHGISYYLPSDTTTNNDGFGLQAAVSGQIGNAKITGSQIMARARVGVEAAARSTSSEGAFRSVWDPVVENLTNSVANRAEIDLFYGCRPACKVSAVNSLVLTITTAEWAPGMWVGQEGAKIIGFDNDAATSGSTPTTITSVSNSARTITVASATGIATSEQLYFAAEPASGSDVISQRRNAAAATDGTGFNSMRGLSSLTSGFNGDAAVLTTILNVAPSSLWGATVYDALSGPLSFQKINRAVADMVPKGAPRKLVLYTNPRGWADLANDEAAQRRYVNQKGGTAVVGPDGMDYHTQAGTMTIKSSPFVKEGDAFAIDPKLFKRIGATDLTFTIPGRDDEFFLMTADFASFEIRCYLNYALFTRALGKSLWIKNIVNNA